MTNPLVIPLVSLLVSKYDLVPLPVQFSIQIKKNYTKMISVKNYEVFDQKIYIIGVLHFGTLCKIRYKFYWQVPPSGRHRCGVASGSVLGTLDLFGKRFVAVFTFGGTIPTVFLVGFENIIRTDLVTSYKRTRQLNVWKHVSHKSDRWHHIRFGKWFPTFWARNVIFALLRFYDIFKTEMDTSLPPEKTSM